MRRDPEVPRTDLLLRSTYLFPPDQSEELFERRSHRCARRFPGSRMRCAANYWAQAVARGGEPALTRPSGDAGGTAASESIDPDKTEAAEPAGPARMTKSRRGTLRPNASKSVKGLESTVEAAKRGTPRFLSRGIRFVAPRPLLTRRQDAPVTLGNLERRRPSGATRIVREDPVPWPSTSARSTTRSRPDSAAVGRAYDTQGAVDVGHHVGRGLHGHAGQSRRHDGDPGHPPGPACEPERPSVDGQRIYVDVRRAAVDRSGAG